MWDAGNFQLVQSNLKLPSKESTGESEQERPLEVEVGSALACFSLE